MATGALAVVSLAATAVGTYASMQAAANQAAAIRNQQNYAAGVAANNAILAKRAADQTISDAQVKEANLANQGNALTGQEKAALAGHGVDVNSGSALSTTSNTTALNQLDQLTLRNQAQRDAYNYTVQGGNFNAASQMDTAAASAAGTAGTYAEVGTALKGAGTVADKWYQFNNDGAFGNNSSSPGP